MNRAVFRRSVQATPSEPVAPAPAEAAGYEHAGEWTEPNRGRFLVGWVIFTVLSIAQFLIESTDHSLATKAPPGPSLGRVLLICISVVFAAILALHLLLRALAP